MKCENLEQVAKENPARYDSQSNGGTEIGVQLLRGLFRTLKLCIESRINKFIPIDHAVIPWLLQHTCLLLNARCKGPDGLTSWSRIRGRPFNQRLIGFAEVVLYKLPVKGPHAQPDGNMGAGWAEAVFLGYQRSSNCYTVATERGVISTRSIYRQPLPQRWSAAAVAKIRATPWTERERQHGEVQFREPPETTADPVPTEVPSAPRRMIINRSDLEAHGYTVDCQQ